MGHSLLRQSGTPSRAAAAQPPPAARLGFGFAALGLLFGLLLIGLGESLQRAFGGMTALAALLPTGYAFAAGMVATVNPCGVLFLPSLVAYAVGRTDAPWTGRLRAAVARGLAATLGFVGLFTLVGAIFALGGHALGAWFPVGGVVVGAALTLLGLVLTLSDRPLGLLAASRAMGRAGPGQDLASLFAFGIAYAVASLGCTLPVFLVVAGLALAAPDPLAAVGQFVAYALGMGLVLSAVLVAASLFQSAVHRWLRRIVPYVHRLAAAFLMGAGLYLAVYWLRAAGVSV
jgi:cytochrome c-type biogenesis protein